MTKYDVIVLGAGAAGLMTAAIAGKEGHKVLVIEHNKQIGRKILISGGGKCNFTNYDVSPKNYFSENPHFSKSALARYSCWDFLDLIYKYDVEFFEKKDGQLFCKKSARDIINILEKECNSSGNVTIHTNEKVIDVLNGENFTVSTNKAQYEVDKVVVATGGLSIPPIGATDFGQRLAKRLGHKIIEMRPALVPFTAPNTAVLSGVSLDCKISNKRISFDESVLFTHKGLSGPGILQISLHWLPGEEITINFLPKVNVEEEILIAKKRRPKSTILSLLKRHAPERFVKEWCSRYMNDPKVYIGSLSNQEIHFIAGQFNRWTIIPSGTEGYRKAEVTVGGVSTEKISSKSMESKIVPGLYFVGEVLDVTGWLGGFNFQWAWASAHACAKSFNQA